MIEQRGTGAGKKEQGREDSQTSKRAPYYLSFLSSVQGSRPRFQELLIWLRGEVTRHGWKQVASCSALTDQPRQLLEVYQLPETSALLSTLEGLEKEPNYQALMQLCKSRRMELTYGLPYDPGAGGPSGPTVDYARQYFLQAILTLRADQLPKFIEAMQQVREFFFKNEWSLVSASQTLTPPYRVTHIWRFGDADELGELMKQITAEAPYAALNSCCEGQWQRLLFELEMPMA